MKTKRNTSGVPGRMIFNIEELSSSQDIVNGFASYFASVFVDDCSYEDDTNEYVEVNYQ